MSRCGAWSPYVLLSSALHHVVTKELTTKPRQQQTRQNRICHQLHDDSRANRYVIIFSKLLSHHSMRAVWFSIISRGVIYKTFMNPCLFPFHQSMQSVSHTYGPPTQPIPTNSIPAPVCLSQSEENFSPSNPHFCCAYLCKLNWAAEKWNKAL